MNRQEQKDKAIELMKTLDIYKPYIQGFKQSDKVCFFERFGGYWFYQEPEIENKLREIESEYGCLVYAVTHERFEYGECYSFLIVPKHKEDWEDLIYPMMNNTFIVFAYVWNKSDDILSEFGSIAVQSFGGGIRRVE